MTTMSRRTGQAHGYLGHSDSAWYAMLECVRRPETLPEWARTAKNPRAVVFGLDLSAARLCVEQAARDPKCPAKLRLLAVKALTVD